MRKLPPFSVVRESRHPNCEELGELAGDRIVKRKQGRSQKITLEDQALLRMAKLEPIAPVKKFVRALMGTEGTEVGWRTAQRCLKELNLISIVLMKNDLSDSHK